MTYYTYGYNYPPKPYGDRQIGTPFSSIDDQQYFPTFPSEMFFQPYFYQGLNGHQPIIHPNPVHTLFEDPLYPIYDFPLNLPQTFSTLGFAPNLNDQQKPPGFIDMFKNKDGTVDLNKMISTAGQLMGTLNQFSAFLKGVSSLIKK